MDSAAVGVGIPDRRVRRRGLEFLPALSSLSLPPMMSTMTPNLNHSSPGLPTWRVVPRDGLADFERRRLVPRVDVALLPLGLVRFEACNKSQTTGRFSTSAIRVPRLSGGKFCLFLLFRVRFNLPHLSVFWHRARQIYPFRRPRPHPFRSPRAPRPTPRSCRRPGLARRSRASARQLYVDVGNRVAS